MHTVAIVEDDESIRERFIADIGSHDDLSVIYDSAFYLDSIKWFTEHEVDVLLVDLGLPDGKGADLIRYCRTNHPTMETMVVSVFGDEKNVLDAIEAGATGYLLKTEPREQIYTAILDLLNGGSPISPTIARMIIKRVEPSPKMTQSDATPKLNKRETEVLQCLVTGMTYQEAADSLMIKIDTVRTYIKSIYAKLEVRSRGQAVYQASLLGISDIDKD